MINISEIDWTESFILNIDLDFTKPNFMSPRPNIVIRVMHYWSGDEYVFGLVNCNIVETIFPLNACSSLKLDKNNFNFRDFSGGEIKIKFESVELEICKNNKKTII